MKAFERFKNVKFLLVLMSLLSLAVLPFASERNDFILLFVSNMLIFIIFSSSWNLLAYSGQGSLGHAAFLGLGGFTSTLIVAKLGLPPLISIFIGGTVSALLGLFVGLLVVRLREWFLAMVTFGIPVIIRTITVSDMKSLKGEGFLVEKINMVVGKISSFQEMLGGYDGLFPKSLVNRKTEIDLIFTTVDHKVLDYYAIAILAVIFVLFIRFLINSKLGFAFAAVRENEMEAKVLGVNTVKYKLMAFVLSAFFAGVAGALLAHHTRYINPAIYGIENSFDPIIYTVIGGLGTVEGPIIGTVFITLLNEILKSAGLTYLKNVIIGLMIVLTVLFLPRGLVSLSQKDVRLGLWNRVRRK